ncbi:MAG TPA: hypothetical protein DCR27_03650 [Lachnospiraceae bacterium]|nr:hypothetical protein [Lachnospiraceae bacterium]
MKKKILVLMMSAFMALSLVACGDQKTDSAASGNGAESQESAADEKVDAYAAALKNMEGVTNLRSVMVMEMDMSVTQADQEQNLSTVTTMDLTCFNDPLHFKIDLGMDMGDLGSINQTVYAEKDEAGNINMYTNDGTNWQTQQVAQTAVEQYDARTNMLAYMDESYQFQEAGTEQVDGANAYKYTGAITGDAMNETLRSSGALDSFSQLGVGESDLEGLMKDLGDIPVTLWIDEATMYPVKVEMDMTDVMNQLMSNLVESMGDQAEGVSMSVPKLKIAMTCSDFNSAADFEIPEEAKAAQ